MLTSAIRSETKYELILNFRAEMVLSDGALNMLVILHKCLYLWQATIQGFQSRGLSVEESEELLQSSVRIAREERDRFWKEYQNKVLAGTARAGSRQRALVAASVGSYGAYLADGSEYRYASLGCRVSFGVDRVICCVSTGSSLFACYISSNVIQVSASRVLLLVFGVGLQFVLKVSRGF